MILPTDRFNSICRKVSLMTKKDEKENEVTVIHEKSSLDYREYISISLKSANVAVDSLIEKALEATKIPNTKKPRKLEAIS